MPESEVPGREEDLQSWACSEASIAERSDRARHWACSGDGARQHARHDNVQAIERVLINHDHDVLAVMSAHSSAI
jgi:hypothetical protein